MPTGIYIRSKKCKRNMSLARIGNKNALGARWKHTSVSIAKIIKSKLGKNNPMYGKHQSLETRLKRGVSLKGKMIREKHPHWVNNPTYEKNGKLLIHRRMDILYGKPMYCSNPECNGKSKKFDWSNVDHKYRLVREDWQRLCRSCHMKYDFIHNFKKG